MGYWADGTTRHDGASLFLASSADLLTRFGLETERAPHLIPLEVMRTPTDMRAHLYAACHEIPGHSQRFQNAPLARATKRVMTDTAESTQRRYDRYTTDKIQECYARVLTNAPVRLVGHGFFIGRGGVQVRRLPDYRVPPTHVLASKTAAAHAKRKARALRGEGGPGRDIQPVVDSRGQSDVVGLAAYRHVNDQANTALTRSLTHGALRGTESTACRFSEFWLIITCVTDTLMHCPSEENRPAQPRARNAPTSLRFPV